MKTKQFFTLLAAVSLVFTMMLACGKKEARLYFVEKYENGKEIGESETFTPGYLTVMVDLKPESKKLGTSKVNLQFVKIKDEEGKSISEQIIDDVEFNVDPSWDYAYFYDPDKVKFSEPGTYKVNLNKADGSFIISGTVKVVKK